ncbi:MAG: hypothetical protein GEU82_13100 [Luteitalea sp.]|nr:hypothetical protein [Luteitalea sp.]
MRRRILMALTLLASIAAPAAAQVVRSEGERPAAPTAGDRGGGRSPVLDDLFTAFQPAAVVQPPREPIASRRRGSMVGYIEDTIVSSKVRVRFDAGLHSHTPDRAEFFYAKCGCYRTLSPADPAYDLDAAGPGPGIVTDLNFQQLYVQGEYAATDRLSLFAELPMRWLQPQSFVPGTGSFVDQRGLSDLRAGVKLALADTAEQMLTAQVKTFLPTGDGLNGLGTDHASIEPAILYYQQLSDRVAVESQVGVWIPVGGSDGVPTSSDASFAGNVLSYGIGPSFELYRSGSIRFAPVVELVGWRVLDGYQTAATADASGTNIVNLKFGARTSWENGGSIYAGYGRALTDADWYTDIFRFEYRFSF